MKGIVRRSLAVVLTLPMLIACGGGEPSGPPPVAQVNVFAAASTLIVGQGTQLTVTLSDASGKPVTGATIGYVSSAPDIASVQQTGAVQALTPGTATITASAQGKSGTVTITVTPMPVAGIIITPKLATLRQGDTVTFTATPVDINLSVLPGRAVTWSSADPTRANVTSSGLVTAISPGSVYIRAASEGVSDSALARVRSPNAPSIASATPSILGPGASATITGTNFSATAADVSVLVNGVVAPVTASTPTSVTFTVPSAMALPCTATGPVPLSVVVNGDTATFNHPLSIATQRSIAVGQSLLLTDAASLACNELPQNGAHYLFTVFNYSASALGQLAVRLDGNAGSPTGPAIASRAPMLSQRVMPVVPRTIDASELALFRQREAAHARVMQLNEQVLAAHPHALSTIRAAHASRVRLSTAAAALPNVGDRTNLRIVHSFSGTLSQYDTVAARAVYVGTKIIIYEDTLAPLAGTMDPEYQSIGQEFDNTTFAVLSNFGDPLVLDAQTDNNGRIVALFSKKVNQLGTGLLGFVGSWDFFPQDEANGYPASNFGEYFYAYVPDPSGTSAYSRDIDTWKRYIRGTLAHEAKHITSFAERIAIDAVRLENRWLEEATAQQSSEMWARAVYKTGWKSNAGWDDGPRCDYATAGATCPDPMIGLMHHFGWLYTFDDSNERRSVVSDNSSDGSSLYGSAWLFARWLTDQYSNGNEGAFLRSLVVQPVDAGVTNVNNRTGRPFSETFGMFTLATVVDDYPGFTPNDPRLTIPSWNTRDIFAGMNQNLVTTGGKPAFPRAFPLNVRTLTYGTLATQNAFVTGLTGGGYIAFDLSGTQTGPQSIGVRSGIGGPAPTNIGMAIVRVR